MKITKYGTVTITAGDLTVTNFEFDCEGGPLDWKAAAVLVCEWVASQISGDLEDSEVVVGGDNFVNGQPLAVE